MSSKKQSHTGPYIHSSPSVGFDHAGSPCEVKLRTQRWNFPEGFHREPGPSPSSVLGNCYPKTLQKPLPVRRGRVHSGLLMSCFSREHEHSPAGRKDLPDLQILGKHDRLGFSNDNEVVWRKSSRMIQFFMLSCQEGFLFPDV